METQEKKKAEKVTSVADVKKEKAEQSKKNRLSGGKDVVVDILTTVNVKFTKDFRRMKKGHVQRISPLAYEFYMANNCVEKID